MRWAIVQGCGLALNEGLLYVFVDDARLDKLVAQALATAIVTVITFLVNRAWTFRMHSHGRVAARGTRAPPEAGSAAAR